MANEQTFLFHVQFNGNVDKAAGLIRNVRVITGNVTAEGHDLEVDATTVTQLMQCASKSGQVPVNLDHGSGIKDTCGYLSNFRVDGADLRADWHLLKSHAEYDATLERAERMPGCFGLSVKFKGKGEKKGPKKFARCEKLISVDCVTQPAANPDGLFSVGNGVSVDRGTERMADPNTDPNNQGAEPTIKDVMALLQQQGQQIAALQQQNEALMAQNEPDLAELANMSPEELANLGYDPAQVQAAVDQALASGELVEGEGDGDGDGAVANAGEGNGGAAAGAPQGAATAAMSVARAALAEVHQFKTQMAAQQRAAEAEEMDHVFSVIETKVTALAAENDRLTTELGTKDAEIKSLRSTLRTGARGVAPGVESETLFSAKEAKAGSFEQLTTAKFSELMKQTGMTEAKAKGQAVDFCVKHHGDAYQEWRANGSKTIAFGGK